jgi:hypothetical protein
MRSTVLTMLLTDHRHPDRRRGTSGPTRIAQDQRAVTTSARLSASSEAVNNRGEELAIRAAISYCFVVQQSPAGSGHPTQRGTLASQFRL